MTAIPVFTSEFFQDPYPTYRFLRENHPVCRTTIPFTDVDVWLVSRYDDVKEGLADARLSSDYANASPAFHAASLAFGSGTVGSRTMLNLDPPDHTRLRRLAASTFTDRRIAQWQTAMRAAAETLLGSLPRKEPVDVLERIAAPLSVEVICTVLGAPPGDSAQLREWGDLIFTADPNLRHLAFEAVESLVAYTSDLIAEKKRHLGTDLMSDLIRASRSPGMLSGDELLATMVGLIVAGYESTIALVGDLFLALLDHPEQHALLRKDISLVDAAIEEVLRYDGPQASSFWRFPTADMEMAGVRIAAHETVLLLVGSAHRDPARYPDPDDFDILRKDKRHLAFGHGIHRCLGAQLARRNARTLLTMTLERFPHMSLAVPRADIVYKPNLIVRGPAFLPLAFDQ